MLKIKSGALQFTIFIAVLIALLLAGLVLYAYTFIYMKEQSKGAIENIKLADIGIQTLLIQKENSGDTALIEYSKNENQIIKTNLSQWGIFQKAAVVTQFRNSRFCKAAILGSLINAQKSPTLYLQDTYNPLSVVGTTSIKGIAYLPSKQAKPGYIAGNSYYGTQLVYGRIEKSSSEFPRPENGFLESINYYLKEFRIAEQNDYINLYSGKKIINSFMHKTKGFYSENPITLENIEIAGNIIIKSETAIKVKKTTFLKDIILIAPHIEIEDQTVGSFQAIASKKIALGKNCRLNYPSALLLFQDNENMPNDAQTSVSDNQIFIGSGTFLKGCVAYIQTKKTPDFQTQILLEENSNIKGQVYCNGNFEIKGTVSGSVFTKQFVANHGGAIYMNHIYNATIENENIPEIYGGILLEQQPKAVIKWLY